MLPPSGPARRFTPHRLLLCHAEMQPPRSQPWLESVEHRPFLLLPAGRTCFGFYRLSFSLVPRFLASKNDKNLWMTNFFSFLFASQPPPPPPPPPPIAVRRLVILYKCQKGDPVTFTCRTPEVDQPLAHLVIILHSSFPLFF